MTLTRRLSQAGFLALTLIGVYALRGNAERWCPFGGVETLYTYWREGNLVCSLGVSNLYILAGLLLSVVVLRRAFCGYLCPIGTISEWLSWSTAQLGLKRRSVPQMVERALACLKYAVLFIILYFTWRTGELAFRGYDPCYALISRHGAEITFWAYVVSGAIAIASLFVTVPFCRWLCPLAAVINPLSRFGFTRVKRDPATCSDCGRCSRVCPMNIPVHRLRQVNVARCTACLSCVSSCPAAGKAALTWGPPKSIGGRWPQIVLIASLAGILTSAVIASYAFPLPSFIKENKPGQMPSGAQTLDLRIRGVKCRGTANMLTYFLFRDDVSEVSGYLKVEAWPQDGYAPVRVTYDPKQTDPKSIEEALTEPYYDRVQGRERLSPFKIEGYSPWEGESRNR